LSIVGNQSNRIGEDSSSMLYIDHLGYRQDHPFHFLPIYETLEHYIFH
jgi:hypothetical protein